MKIRKWAANDIEKNFFRLMNNTVSGKNYVIIVIYTVIETMENTQKRIRIEVVSCPQRL